MGELVGVLRQPASYFQVPIADRISRDGELLESRNSRHEARMVEQVCILHIAVDRQRAKRRQFALPESLEAIDGFDPAPVDVADVGKVPGGIDLEWRTGQRELAQAPREGCP